MLPMPAKRLAETLTHPGSLTGMVFDLGRAWERRQLGQHLFRIGDRVKIRQAIYEQMRARCRVDGRPAGVTIADKLAELPSQEGVIAEHRIENGGVLVRHNSDELLGWAWHEIDPAEAP